MLKEYAPGNNAWYALRRTLPLWSWEENLEELVVFSRRFGVDEVIVKVDTEEFSHNHLRPEQLEKFLPALNAIRKTLIAESIYYSLNPWITVGHCDRGRDNRGMLFQMMTGHNGEECRACVCQLDELWRGNITKLWEMYASTSPHVMWVEDDLRTFNHRPVRFGCFCNSHLERFSKQQGRIVGREELVKALLAPGEPHSWRGKWLDMQGEIIVEIAGLLTKAVHKVNPQIMLGLMSSGPDHHCLEGRKWKSLADALADGSGTVLSRPPLGSYSEHSLRGIQLCTSSIRKTRKALPPGVIELTEVENVPFSAFSKSAAFTGLQMSASIALGCHGMTMNLFDHLGNPMNDTPEFGVLLGDRKKYLDALAGRSTVRSTFKGVGILQHEKASYHRKLLPGAGYATLADDGGAWANLLEGLGIAVSWDWEHSPVLALSGQTARAFGRKEAEAMLSKGVLCDLSAAQALADMGLTDYLGAAIEEIRPIHDYGPAAAEELTDGSFGGAPGRYLSATMPNLGADAELGLLNPFPGAKIVSRLVDMVRRTVSALLTLFENSRGGRVAVMPYDLRNLPEGNSFMHPYRRIQMRSVLTWLARGNLPLFVEAGAHALPVCAEEDGYTRIIVFNLSLDPWKQTTIRADTAGRTPVNVEFLEEAGEWRSISRGNWAVDDDACLVITHTRKINFACPGVWCVFWD